MICHSGHISIYSISAGGITSWKRIFLYRLWNLIYRIYGKSWLPELRTVDIILEKTSCCITSMFVDFLVTQVPESWRDALVAETRIAELNMNTPVVTLATVTLVSELNILEKKNHFFLYSVSQNPYTRIFEKRLFEVEKTDRVCLALGIWKILFEFQPS